ncbi:MAG: helix-turn-helix domain-containing protein [Serpentinimonas sp.]|jgi:AraC-like DNA-binding protein|nr:helix-turn-helix domain-containing protein [Serpentinimonas sp.]
MVQPAQALIRSWSTSVVPEHQRLDYWVGAISEGFLAMDASARRGSFHGELISAPLDGIGVNRVRADSQKVWRTPSAISCDQERCCYLLGNLEHAWRVEQDGCEARLLPGDFVMVDARRPYHFDFADGVHCVSLELPLDWVCRWVAEPQAHVAQAFRRSEPGWGSALASFAGVWTPSMTAQPPLPPHLLSDQLGALLALACQPRTERTGTPNLLQQITDVVRQRLSEPGLSAHDVASAVGISVRSLHRAMAAHQQTFAQLLMSERMRVARHMLQNPKLAHTTAAEIGRRVGILDASHFSRLCRSWLGHSARALRPS